MSFKGSKKFFCLLALAVLFSSAQIAAAADFAPADIKSANVDGAAAESAVPRDVVSGEVQTAAPADAGTAAAGNAAPAAASPAPVSTNPANAKDSGFKLEYSVIAGVVVVIILAWFFIKGKKGKTLTSTDALYALFGEPAFTTKFTLQEATEWIKSRNDKLAGGGRAAVVKVNNNTMRKLGNILDVKGIENYLALVILDRKNKITDSLLIKYDNLEQKLEDVLAKGDGVLVVEG